MRHQPPLHRLSPGATTPRAPPSLATGRISASPPPRDPVFPKLRRHLSRALPSPDLRSPGRICANAAAPALPPPATAISAAFGPPSRRPSTPAPPSLLLPRRRVDPPRPPPNFFTDSSSSPRHHLSRGHLLLPPGTSRSPPAAPVAQQPIPTAQTVVTGDGCCFKNRLHRISAFHYPNWPVLVATRRPRNVVVRSDIVAGSGAAAGDSSQALSELQVASRVRGVCFYIVTAIVAIFLFVAMLAVHPFVLLFDRYRRRAQHYIAKVWATLTISMFYKLEIEGMENLPPNSSPAVYVANHQSFLDIYTLLTLGRCFKLISKTSIFVIPIIGWAMYLMGIIPLQRMDSRSQLDCFKRCVDLVKKGASVFFFPEGTRSKDGKLGAFKRGAFSVAVKTSVPVVPITLLGTGKLMPSGMEGILNSGSVKVVIHRPIEEKDAETLCSKARNVIADTLLLHGCRVH